MSTVSNAPSGPPAKGAATEAAKEALHDHLRKTASFIKILDLLVAMFSWICGGLLLWFVACLIDHWVYPLPPLGRWVFWLVGVGVTAWWTVTRVVPLALRRINLAYAAQRIENLVPEFKNGLISWLELEELPQHGVPKGVMAALTYRAKRYIGGQDPSATVDTSLLIKLLGCMLLLTVGMVMYSMASPKSVATTGKRILFPWTTLTAPARVEILKVDPGPTEITHGNPLQVEVELKGLKPEEPVMLRFSTLDGQIRDRALQFEPITEGFRYGITLITSERGVEQELDYWVEAGDALAGPYRVSLNPLPTVVLDSVQLEYPAYTGLKPRNVLAGGEVEAVEGTKATVIANSNLELHSGKIEFNPEFDEEQKYVGSQSSDEMQVEGKQLSYNMLLRLNEAKENPTAVRYRLRGFNESFEGNLDPLVHQVDVLADLLPEVSVASKEKGPEVRLLRVSPVSLVELEVRANDPDFGLSLLQLQLIQDGVKRGETELFRELQGVRGSQVKTSRLDLSKLKLQPGARLQVVATASDNRHDPESSKWAPNKVLSEALTLEVVGPKEKMDIPPPPPKEQEQKKPEQNQPQDGSEQNPAEKNSSGDEQKDSEGTGSGSNSHEGGESGSQDNQTGSEGEGTSESGTGDSSEGPENTGGSSTESGSKTQSSNDDPSNQGDSSSTRNARTSASNPESSSTGNESPTGEDPKSLDSSPQDPSEAGSRPQDTNDVSDSNRDPSDSQGARSREGVNSESGARRGKPQSDKEAMERIRDHMEKKRQDNPGAPENNSSEKNSADGQPGAKSQEEDAKQPEKESAASEGNPKQGNDPGDEKGGESQPRENPEQGKDPTAGEEKSGSQEGQQGTDTYSDTENEQRPGNQQDPKSTDPNGGNPQQPGEQQPGKQEPGENSGGSGERGSKDGQSPGEQSGSSSESDSEGSESGSEGGEAGESSGAGEKSGEKSGAGGGKEKSGDESNGDNQESKASDNDNTSQGSGQSKSSSSSSNSQSGSKSQNAGQAKSGSSSSSGPPGSQGGSSSGGGEGGGSGTPDEVNEDYAKRTADMVLDELNRQKDQPDPELLKDLDWTEDDLREFADRWNKARDLGVNGTEQDRKEWEEKLDRLGLNPKSSGPRQASKIKDNFRKMLDAGARPVPPERIRRPFDDFLKAMRAKQSGATE